MGDINHDAEPIHFGNDSLSKLADPVMLRFFVPELGAWPRGIGNVIVATVRQRDVAGAKFVVTLEEREISTNGIPVFNADGSESKDFLPLYDATMGDIDQVFELLEAYLHNQTHPQDQSRQDTSSPTIPYFHPIRNADRPWLFRIRHHHSLDM